MATLRVGLTLLMLLLLPLVPRRAAADDARRPEACVANTLSSNEPVNARERIGPTGFMALASFDSDGWPTITFAPAFFGLPPTVQAFLALHECGHLVLRTTNEFEANCYALKQGGWSASELAMIETSHLSLGQLPPQYGGSGLAFWLGTKRTCSDYFRMRATGP